MAGDLFARGVTRPGWIAAEGGSNGSLLIASIPSRYPDPFGTLACSIPLIDMRRYTKLLASGSSIGEYGDPDDLQDWAFLLSIYLPRRRSRAATLSDPAGQSRDNNRVHLGHTRQMAQKLLVLGYDVAFYEPATGGHGTGKDSEQTAGFRAQELTSQRQAFGWKNPVA